VSTTIERRERRSRKALDGHPGVAIANDRVLTAREYQRGAANGAPTLSGSKLKA
jgi:hypothetical protein